MDRVTFIFPPTKWPSVNGFHCFILVFCLLTPISTPIIILCGSFSTPLSSKFGFHFGFAKALQGQLLGVGNERVSIAAKPWIL